MHSIPVDLSFTDANRCPRVLHAVTTDGYGWHVRAVLEGRVFTRDCSDWQHVVRTRGWLHAHSHAPTANATPAALRSGMNVALTNDQKGSGS